MTEKLKQIVKKEVGKLPQEMQKAINSLDWGNVVEEIGKRHFLADTESINDLQVETLLVLVGLEYGDSYVMNIEDNVGTSRPEAERIATEVMEKIFSPINNILNENIKNTMKNKNPDLSQVVDFIHSGGDYTNFLTPATEENKDKETPSTESVPKVENIINKLII